MGDRGLDDLVLRSTEGPTTIARDLELHILRTSRFRSMATRVYLTAPIYVEGPTGLVGEAQLHGPQGKLMLAMLALEHRRPVGRDELADELWPDGLPSSVDTSVKVLISKVRSALRGVTGDLRLEGTIGYYQLHVARSTTIDVELAAARIHSAEAAFRSRAIDAAAADALIASMIASRPFLPGFDGPWATASRARLVDVRLRALDLLSQVWLERDEPDQAARDAQAILEIDPYREEAHRTLIRAHLARDDRAAAARAYARCADLLSNELGIEPTMETRALLESARSGQAGGEGYG
jgi:SARP family transcriptional regulator, regulator of embCAB operon